MCNIGMLIYSNNNNYVHVKRVVVKNEFHHVYKNLIVLQVFMTSHVYTLHVIDFLVYSNLHEMETIINILESLLSTCIKS